ncbi:MAG TPA: methionyl-tRNA formyltransferase [Bacteroidales bacterium]|nr:methionyl-tRNA formyltransferase [Bacteroidales bacterium]
MKNLRIIFMGTPEFAVASLGSLLMNGFNVVAVVTAPDKPAGRGRQISKSPVKEFAEFSSLPILQPSNLKDPAFIHQLQTLKPDLFIVVAFRMLPAEVWKIPSMGTINLHASLLPQYRGSAPINHAIINGETMTGLTTFYIDDKIDTGNILLREEVPIFSFENAGDLHDRMMVQGARMIIRTLSEIVNDNLRPKQQSEFIKQGDILINAPKITPEFCTIDWKKDALSIHNFIRGLAPYPGAHSWFYKGSKPVMFKIFESNTDYSLSVDKPGKIFSDGKNFLRISCSQGYINICSLQVEGKKKMSTVEFLRGFRLEEYSKSVIQQVS